MRLMPLLLLIILNVGCGSHAPTVTRYLVSDNPSELLGSRSGKAVAPVLPLKADKFICQAPTYYQLAKTYLLNLEKAAAQCKAAPKKPSFIDCEIDGASASVLCSDGKSLSWSEAAALKYLCVSPTDWELLQNYRNELLTELANCK